MLEGTKFCILGQSAKISNISIYPQKVTIKYDGTNKSIGAKLWLHALYYAGTALIPIALKHSKDEFEMEVILFVSHLHLYDLTPKAII